MKKRKKVSKLAARRPAGGIGKLGQRRQVVIPRSICDLLNLREGDLIEVGVAHGVVLLKPKKLVDAGDLLTPEEESLVREGERQLHRGRSSPWTDVKKRLKL